MKRKDKNLTFITSILLVSVLISSGMLIFSDYSIDKITNNDDTVKEQNLKISLPINIITPEPRLYYEQDSGYFPGTYGFESDEDGTDPDGWNVLENGGSLSVIAEKEGHKKVVKFHKTSSGKHVKMSNKFTNQTEGTIEFWLLTTSLYRKEFFTVYDDGVCIVQFYFDSDWKLSYISGNQWLEGFQYVPFTWYWFSVHIDMTTEPPEDDTYDLTIYDENGNLKHESIGNRLYGEYQGNYFDEIKFSAQKYAYGWDFYVDAIGYSWDPIYDPEFNKQEGIMLEFTPNELDYICLYYDNRPSVEINGRKCLPWDFGTHIIQVTGWLNGYYYQSSLVNYEITPLKIISPIHEQTYHDCMTGYYPGTFGFENETDGTSPGGWDASLTTGSCSTTIFSEYEGHKKVLSIKTGSGIACIKRKFNPSYEGRIEFWFLSSNIMKSTYITLGCSTGDAVKLGFIQGHWKADFGNGYEEIQDPPLICWNSIWYYVQIEFSRIWWSFEMNHDKTRRLNRLINSKPINSLMIFSDPDEPEVYTAFFDAFSFSMETHYGVADNKYPGMLLDFKHTIEKVTSIEYRLNNGDPVIINGPTVLPIYKWGTHLIELTVTDIYGVEWVDTCEFTLDKVNKIAVFLYSSDTAQDPDFTEYVWLAESHVHNYANILWGENFRKIYIFRDIRAEDYDNFMNQLQKFRVGPEDVIFFYMWAHGWYEKENGTYCSQVYVNNFDDFYIRSNHAELDNFKDRMDALNTSNKGHLIDACMSGGFVENFGDPYLAISCADTEHYGIANNLAREGIFSAGFWGGVSWTSTYQAYLLGCANLEQWLLLNPYPPWYQDPPYGYPNPQFFEGPNAYNFF